jgi:transposase-like protein
MEIKFEQETDKCIHCKSSNIFKSGTLKGQQRYECKDCKKTFYAVKRIITRSRYPVEIVSTVIDLRDDGLHIGDIIKFVRNVYNMYPVSSTIRRWTSNKSKYRLLIEGEN